MTNQQHPIIPPTKLVEIWRADASNIPATYSTDFVGTRDYIDFIATAAAQWGWDQRGAATEAELQRAADQELEACCQWLFENDYDVAPETLVCLRAARRPKPLSLKEQALNTLDKMSSCMRAGFIPKRSDLDTIRCALEALPND